MKKIIVLAVLACSGVAEALYGAGDKQSRDLAYGPRKPMVPPVELYADVLMETGRIADAAMQYDAMMARMPNRTQSLLGAARAAEALGDHEKARRRYTELGAIWADSDETPGLREVKTHTSETSP